MNLNRDNLEWQRRNVMSLTGGEWFIKILQKNGFKYIFGTTGGGIIDIQDALASIKPPFWIQGLHEFCSVSAAMGYALVSESAAICLIDRIVGTTNSLGAMYAAHQNYAPIVIFASQNLPSLASGYLPDGRPRYAIHYHSWQSILTTPWTKWRCEIPTLNLMPPTIQKAIAIAETEPTGPTYITLRQDLMAKRVPENSVFFTSKSKLQSRLMPDDKSLDVAAKAIVEAENPIIWVVYMGRHASAVEKLVELAELTACGVLDGRVFMNFPMNHPLFLGFLFYREKNPLVENADILINIEVYYEPPLTPPENCKVINIAPEVVTLRGMAGGDYGSSYYPSHVNLTGDTTLILERLTSKIKKMLLYRRESSLIKERKAEIQSLHEETLLSWRREVEKHLDDFPISPHLIAHELNRLWSDRTIWFDSTLTVRNTLYEGIMLNKPGSYFSNPSVHLGPIASAAYGGALAKPDGTVIATVGDGDFIMGNPVSVLWTCSHHHIPVLYIVFNNACWGIEWFLLQDAVMKRAKKLKNYEFVDLDEPRIDFYSMARSLGVHSEVIEGPDEAREVLERAIATVQRGEPALIDVHLKKYTEGKSTYTFIFKRPLEMRRGKIEALHN